MIRKLLIANRGEIACRIARTARRLGLAVAAVYSDADARARHVRLADEAWHLGRAAASDSYLCLDKVLEAARRSGADAVHPGYGFLAENAELAARCVQAGIAFVGPPAHAIAAMGSKSAAKARMQKAGVPVLPGYHGDEQDPAALERHARATGFPLLIKPSAGGGGKGMQIVETPGELHAALQTAKRIARAAFGDDRLLLERYLPAPRHVEVQVFADRHGNIVHLFDRDCSIQRRHQKLIEEAPAPRVDPDVRSALHAAALVVAKEIGYEGAGTVEFLLNGREFFFLEMNTRLQVEHPVTEAITGLDLVEWQLRVAAGEPLPLKQSDITARGHAIEARVCAENPVRDFIPSAGVLRFARWPEENETVRVDHGFESGDTVSSHYDSLLGKVIAKGNTRGEATDRLDRALLGLRISGVATNSGWLAQTLEQEDFRNAELSTGFVERHAELLRPDAGGVDLMPFAAAALMAARQRRSGNASAWDAVDGFRAGASPAGMSVTLRAGDTTFFGTAFCVGENEFEVDTGMDRARLVLIGSDGTLCRLQPTAGGEHADVFVHGEHIAVWRGHAQVDFDPAEAVETSAGPQTSAEGALSTPLPGVVVGVAVSEGQSVKAGEALLVVEAMKMEHVIRAPHDGIVTGLKQAVGDRVTEGVALLEIKRSSV